jgi:hypothetical protein
MRWDDNNLIKNIILTNNNIILHRPKKMRNITIICKIYNYVSDNLLKIVLVIFLMSHCHYLNFPPHI